ncbi:MAG: hypothetical protein ACFFCD_17985 [Promethearchaeota archaeon]
MVDTFRYACLKELPQSFGITGINEMEKCPFNSIDTDDGFIILDSSDGNVFYIQYLYKMPITYGQYDGGFVKKTECTIKEITFELDISNRLLIVFSGSSLSDYFARKMMNKFNQVISSCEINFLKLIDILETSGFILRSEQAVINGFVYKDIMVGKYVVDIKDMDILKNTISKYGTKVEKVKLDIEATNGTRCILNIGKNGMFVFGSFKEENYDFLKSITSKMLSEEYVNEY